MARKQTRKNMHYFTIRATGRKTIRIPCKARNASKPVMLSRTIQDALQGQEGLAITCANAMCALREDGNAFPHKVFMAEFVDNRAYICDKLNKQNVPVSCVVYAHNQGSFQRQYDTKGKNAIAKMSGVEASFILYPPPPRVGGSSGPGSGKQYSDRKTKRPIRRGAIARAERAGINLTGKKVAG